MSTRTASPNHVMPAPTRARRRAAAVVLLIALAVAACGPEPTPTPTPTATPTPTPTPTATPTPLPPTPTPTPEPISKVDPGETGEFTVTESTTGADVMALLSESEIACVGAEIDPEAAQALLNVPLLENLALVHDIPLECIETGKAITLLVAVHEAETGGLSAETKACLRDLYAESPWMLGSEEPEEVTPEVAASLFGFYLCFSDEEAAALDASTDSEEAMPFKPSELRCVMEEFGGVEKFAASIESDSQDFDLTYDFMAAAYVCGTNLGLGQ